LKNGLIAMVILLFFFMVVRPFLRWATLGETEKEINLMPRTVAELQASRRDEGLLALSKAASAFDETEPLDKKEETELKEKIMERLGTTPRKGFRIVQDWLDEDNHLLKLEAA
jgi:flagellar biosynthesis/type III secretory pathway M-ring protein FliF/YscJ